MTLFQNNCQFFFMIINSIILQKMEESVRRVQIIESNKQNQDTDRINRLLCQYEKSIDLEKRIKFQQKQQMAKSSYLLQNGWRRWLGQKGRGFLIDFNQYERKKLKDFFNTLDKKKCGSIGLDQMQQMLLSLGLADNMDQVKKLLGNIDQNHSGKIQFQQFITMIQDDSKQHEQIINFFKQLIFSTKNENLNHKQNFATKINHSRRGTATQSQRQIFKSKLPFQMIVNQIRRNHILSSMNIGRCKTNGQFQDITKISKGKDVVKALQKMDQRRLLRRLRQNSQQQVQGSNIVNVRTSSNNLKKI